ncbi:uncharacterized protein LOC144886191 [Branchiostoma floridae x Branchiostoma japonicum]
MSYQKLFPNRGAAPEGSARHNGDRRAIGIFSALSGAAAVVSLVALLFAMRELASMRGQQVTFMKDVQDQQLLLRSQLQDLKNKMESRTSALLGPEGSTEGRRREDSATFWRSGEVHHRAKRASKSTSAANAVLRIVRLKLERLGCLSGTPGNFCTELQGPVGPPGDSGIDGKDGGQGPPGPPGPPGQCSCTESTIATPVTMTTEPQVTLVETMTTEPQVTPVVTMTTAPPTVVDCSALYASGQTTSGVYTLGPGVQAYCDMETAAGGWTVIQRRQDGSTLFNRTWEEYKLGFGNISGEYWLGNDNIHLLTSQKAYSLRVDLMDWEGQRKNAQYSFFKVSGESDQYRLHTISGYSGNAGNSMSSNKGYRFSTVDMDNDYDGLRHCAQVFGQGGWWYGSCSVSLLNGLYYRGCGNSCPPWQGVVWHHWRGWRYSLKAVSMKIRPW